MTLAATYLRRKEKALSFFSTRQKPGTSGFILEDGVEAFSMEMSGQRSV